MLVSRDPALLAAGDAGRAGRSRQGLPADLSRGAEVGQVAAQASEFDLLVNNAGAIPPGNLPGVDPARRGRREAAWWPPYSARPAKPNEIADAVTFAVSLRSRHTTGTTLTINGASG